MKYKNIVIIHKSDVDGIISGLMFRKYLMDDILLIFCGYGQDQEKAFTYAANIAEDKKVYIGDISGKDFLLSGKKETILQTLAERAEKIEWYDHHPATREFIPLLEKYGHEIIMGDKEGICASKLIQGKLFPGDSYLKKMAQIAQFNDYPPAKLDINGMFLQCGLGLQKIISYHNAGDDIQSLADLIDFIAKDFFWYRDGKFNLRLQKIIDSANKQLAQANDKMFKNCFILQVKGKKFAITCGESIMPQKESLAKLRDKFAGQVDGVCVYFLPPLSTMLFYKDKNSDFNAQKFCEYVGGGGREGNGGFAIQIPGDEKYKKFIDFMKSKLNLFL